NTAVQQILQEVKTTNSTASIMWSRAESRSRKWCESIIRLILRNVKRITVNEYRNAEFKMQHVSAWFYSYCSSYSDGYHQYSVVRISFSDGEIFGKPAMEPAF